MAKGSKGKQAALREAAAQTVATSREPSKHEVPSEKDVHRALMEAEQPKQTTKRKQAAGVLYYLAVVFAVLTAALFFQLIRDDMFIRRRAILPWQPKPIYDRLFVLATGALGYLLAALVFDRRGLLRICRRSWRTQRREFINVYKDTWKHRRTVLFQYLLLFSTIGAAAVGWRMVIALTSCDAPIVVVLSGSMETAFYRGDLLFLTNDQQDPILPGEIVVFKIDGRDIPIVHRVMQAHLHDDGTYSYLTKGDNNQGNDRSLYAPGQIWLERHNIVGRARFFLPYIGMITVKLNEYPLLKMLVIVGMLGMIIWSREL